MCWINTTVFWTESNTAITKVTEKKVQTEWEIFHTNGMKMICEYNTAVSM
jgi:hypothetical protein